MKEKFIELLKCLNEGLYDKHEAVSLSLLAAIAGESIFLLGPPGVGKSLIARKMKHIFAGGRAFEYLMSRFSTPEEVFGPISVNKLKNEDKYERNIEKYLPDSDIVFLDEIWKASPAIQNSLLTAVNEKIYRNGNIERQIPMKVLIAASNEIPDESEGLEALYDRFIIRCYVDNIKDSENFSNMILDTQDPYKDNVPETLKITDEEYFACKKGINSIKVPSDILSVIDSIRKAYPDLSDRRWKKIVHILRASAFINGREGVDNDDLILILYCLNDSVNTLLQKAKSLDNEINATIECKNIPQRYTNDIKHSSSGEYYRIYDEKYKQDKDNKLIYQYFKRQDYLDNKGLFTIYTAYKDSGLQEEYYGYSIKDKYQVSVIEKDIRDRYSLYNSSYDHRGTQYEKIANLQTYKANLAKKENIEKWRNVLQDIEKLFKIPIPSDNILFNDCDTAYEECKQFIDGCKGTLKDIVAYENI